MYQYDKERIKANPLNKYNARLVPEQVQNAIHDMHQAQRMGDKTPAQQKAKAAAVEEARRVYDERKSKLDLYREIFPDLNL